MWHNAKILYYPDGLSFACSTDGRCLRRSCVRLVQNLITYCQNSTAGIYEGPKPGYREQVIVVEQVGNSSLKKSRISSFND